MHTIAVHLISYTQLVRFPCTSNYQNSVAVGNVHGTQRMNAPAHFSAFKLICISFSEALTSNTIRLEVQKVHNC